MPPGTHPDTAPARSGWAGVRPSSGAAIVASQAASKCSNLLVWSRLAAPEDGRTPGAVSGYARSATAPEAGDEGVAGCAQGGRSPQLHRIDPDKESFANCRGSRKPVVNP